MYVISVKFCRVNTSVVNVWNPRRNVHFVQKCKDCLSTLLTKKQCQHETAVPEPVEEIAHGHDPAPVTPTTTTPHYCGANVVIIGAGAAGLSAANHLQDNGITNVTVLEAKDRPGGRVQSCWFGDTVIELGSRFGNVPTRNPILEQVFEDGFGEPLINQVDLTRGLLHRPDGSKIPYPVCFEVYQIFKQIWNQAHTIEYEESGQGRQSVMHFVGSRIEQEISAFPLNHQVDAERVFHGLASLASARSSYDDSLIHSDVFGSFVKLPGSKLKVPLGVFGEINTMYESLPPDQVRFGKQVTKIKWGGVSGVYPRALVVCEDGECFEADYVIITIPLGVLKALSGNLFCPGLPASKLDAILKIPTGHVNKVFLEFNQPFWVWNRNVKETKFDPQTMNHRTDWLKGLCTIRPMRGSSHVLCITVAGPQAQVMEFLSDKDLVHDLMPFLQEQAGKSSFPEPVKIKRTSWSCDPQFYGAYSYEEPGVTSNDFYSLASPLPEHSDHCDPVLLFAGEATCPIMFGSFKGARASGIREAERLLQLVRLQEAKEQKSQYMEI